MSRIVPSAIARQPWHVFVPLVALVLFGAAVLDSAAGGRFNTWAFSHLVRFAVFSVMALIIARVPREFFKDISYPTYAAVLILLVLVEALGDRLGGGGRVSEAAETGRADEAQRRGVALDHLPQRQAVLAQRQVERGRLISPAPVVARGLSLGRRAGGVGPDIESFGHYATGTGPGGVSRSTGRS